MLSTHRPDILVLLEPRISGDKADEVCKKLNFDEWARVESVGCNGGLWLFWRVSVLNVAVVHTSP